MRIRTRLLIIYLLIVSIVGILLVRWVLRDLKPSMLGVLEEAMTDTASHLAAAVSPGPGGDRPMIAPLDRVVNVAHATLPPAAIYSHAKTNVDLRIYVTDAHGIVIFDSDEGRDVGRDYSRWNDVMRTLRGEYGARTTPPGNPTMEGTALYVAAPVLAGTNIVGCLTVAKPPDGVRFFLRTTSREIIIISAGAGIVAVGLLYLLTVWITRPVHALTDYARATRDGLRPLAPPIDGSEFGELTAAFTEMREAIDGRRYIEEYVQSLTHEMKSPLSSLQGAAELLQEELPEARRKKFIENIHAEATRMRELVDRLLELAAIEARQELEDCTTIALSELVTEIADRLAPHLNRDGIELALEIPEGIELHGDPFLVRQALANVIRNAVEFSPAGSSVHVRARPTPEGIEITVHDYGPGIPAYAVNRIFERFYSLPRPASGRKSSGLGLPFVRQVMALHGGTVSVTNAPTSGAIATLTFTAS